MGNEGLEALRRICLHLVAHDETQHKEFDEYVNAIEKELKAKANLVSMCENLAKLVGLKEKDYVELETLITKKLKALEIIKNHIVNRDLDTSGVYLEYHLGLFEPYYSIEIKRGANQTITEKEYDLLKEVLK